MTISSNAFRLYDIRGIVAHELPLCHIYSLGNALAAYIIQKNPAARKIIIGRDGRTHSAELQNELVRALFIAGFAVHDTGLCPTPVIYFAAHMHGYDAAVMVTASHNGPEYNGIKLCIGTETVWGDQIKFIESLYRQGATAVCKANGGGAGLYMRVSLTQEYITYMADHFADLKGIDMPIIADCGNGAVGSLLRTIVDAVGLSQVVIMCEEVDGTYPNHQADPIHAANMAHVADEVVARNAPLGVGFDGDGDRMAALTGTGKLVLGDRLLALFAKDILARHPGRSVVFDTKCLLLVPETIRRYGGVPYRSPSGHSRIKRAVQQQRAVVAGELSCHFFFADDYFGYDDGIYAFFRLVRLLSTTAQTLDEHILDATPTYSTQEERIFCPDHLKESVMALICTYFEHKSIYSCSFDDGVRIESDDGWGLLRASHTQPALCMRCESTTPEGLHQYKIVLADALSRALAQIAPKHNVVLIQKTEQGIL